MVGKIYLGGGGNEKIAFEVDDNFFKDINSVLYIPIAWPNEDFKSCLKWFLNMSSLHKKLKIKMWKGEEKTPNLDKFDSIYIGGGNTFKLLKRLKESGIGEELIKFYNKGGKIFRGSAGAIIWGRDIKTALICKDKDKNEVKITNTSGFNQVKNYDIQCHFEKNQIKEHQEYTKKTGRKIICIPEETAAIIGGSKIKVIGTKQVVIIDKESYKILNPNSETVI